MGMKIDSVNPQLMIKKYMSGVRIRETAKSTPQKDKVELSDSAVAFASAMKAARADNTGRSPEELLEIEEITRRVQDGTFNVPGREIAGKMLESILFEADPNSL